MKRLQLIVTVLVLLLGSCTPGERQPGIGTPGAVTSTVGDWQLQPAADPDAPPLLEKNEDHFKLKPEWQVDSIEYVDAWWGLGKPELNTQLVKREGSGYKLDDSAVSADDVQELIKAVDRLYPAQMLMEGTAWTDDYASWRAEITGTDGQRVLLFASSTGNPGYGPWNVLYNGRLYAQYDGSLAKPLGKLFGGRLGAEGDPFLDPDPARQVNFSTIGLPPQLTHGFWGLLPVSEGFSYTADAVSQEIKGQVIGSSRIGSMEIGRIKALDSIELSVGESQVSCKVELLPEGDPWTATTAWAFSCPVKGAKEGEHYRYPVKARFGTEEGRSIDVAGELWGTWKHPSTKGYIVLPPPPEIETALAAHPMSQELLTDHIIGASKYSATLTATVPLEGQRNGEVILFGQAEAHGKKIQYTVGAQFVIQDGKLIYWNLDRAAISQLVGKVITQPLTRRVLEASPHAVIIMWYASGVSPQAKSPVAGHYLDIYGVFVNPCGDVPGGAFPSTGKVLWAFSYNDSPYCNRNRVPFLIIDDRPVVADLILWADSTDPVQQALLPDALNTGSSKPFGRIYMETVPYSGGGPTLHVGIPTNVSAEERAVYDKLLKALPGTVITGESQMVVRGVTLAVDGDGKLQVVSCSTQPTTGASPTSK